MATVIFVLTYVLISLGENSPRKLDRPTAALLGAVLMLLTGSLSRGEANAAMDYQTLAVLFGMMVLLACLIQSGLPMRLAFRALDRMQGPQARLGFVVFASGIAAAFMLNDTVCLLATPLLLEITDQAGIAPKPYLLALATSANIGSAMTLTGNPQNIIIGHASGWGWAAFALRMVPIGLVCLAANLLLLRLFFRKDLAAAQAAWKQPEEREITVRTNLARKSVLVFGGLIVAFLAGAPMDIAAVSAATVLLIWANRPPRLALDAVDWPLLLFFAGLFIVVGGFVKADGGILTGVVTGLEKEVGARSIVELSAAAVLGSNLFSNVPFVLIASHWVQQMNHPQFVWALLALTSTFSGNLTLFGSVANVIVAQGAQSRVSLRFGDFLRIGIPVTLVTTVLGVAMLAWMLRMGWM